jgi:S-adenosylmethionine:tRNA ribosyltransferase-isomerase
MIAASAPIQRPSGAKLLVIDRRGDMIHRARSEFVNLLRPGDVVIANDAATLPASLFGRHAPTGGRIEVRLAARDSLDQVTRFSAVVFGEGDFRTRTEDRPQPPILHAGDVLELGPLRATVAHVLQSPRLVLLEFANAPHAIWEGLARHGRPIQYSHVPDPLAIWDTWTPIAGEPVAFEPPSAGFILDWKMLATMTTRNIRFATLTHAAGISSTGDPQLDALLPFDEPYRIPQSTARTIEMARGEMARGEMARGEMAREEMAREEMAREQEARGRIIAIGTSVVRALEHSAAIFDGAVPAGERVATQRIDGRTTLRVVDAILTGTHERGGSHYELLRAFAGDDTLAHANDELNAHNYRTHEFGDSLFLEHNVPSRDRQRALAAVRVTLTS